MFNDDDNYEVDLSEKEDFNEDINKKSEEQNEFALNEAFKESQNNNLGSSNSTNYSTNTFKNVSIIEGINYQNNSNYNSISSEVDNNEKYLIYSNNNEQQIKRDELVNNGISRINNINKKEENGINNISIIKEQNNNKENTLYKNTLKLIIDSKNNKIINSIIISENNFFINYITNSLINFTLLQNKKVCFLFPDTKRAQSIYESYKTNANIKSILLQKGKNKKNKNDLQSFSEQLSQNNLFIILPNILYKLLSIGFVKFSDFGLIIFDECQLSDSNHPYNIIMQEFYFFYFKFPSQIVNIKTLPKILGLTQSPFKDKVNIKNEKKGEEILTNISENLDCQIVLDPELFIEDKNNNEENIDIIGVKSIFEQKNKIDGINIILMKYFFEPMLDFCLDNYLKVFGDKKELNQFNIKEIKSKYVAVLKEKFSKELIEEYNKVETSERTIHFLSQNSTMFKTFEDIQKMLINIIQNGDLMDIYYLFVKYKELYENNLNNIKESKDNNNNNYLKKFYKKLIYLFEINIRAFKRLLDKKVEYKADRLNKFMNKLNDIYNNNKNSKSFICVNNRKMVYILYNYLNRESLYKNKIGFVVGTNNKKEENISLTLSIRSTNNEINERKKEYNDNKLNILICTTPGLEYLTKEKCDNIFIFSELSNTNNDLEKIKEKGKNSKAKMFLFLNEAKMNKINSGNISNKENKDNNIQLKKYFLDKDKNIENPKDYRTKNYIEKKNLEKNYFYYIKNTEAKITIKNCMLLFNEINNLFFSKNIKINIEKNIIENKEEPKFICESKFQWKKNEQKFRSNKYNDKQSAESECYLQFIIFLYKNGEIDDHFRIKM